MIESLLKNLGDDELKQLSGWLLKLCKVETLQTEIIFSNSLMYNETLEELKARGIE
jgi:hypothetical protein